MPATVRDHLGGRIPPGWTPAPCVDLGLRLSDLEVVHQP
jgi:hypothetical protein